MFFFKLLKIFTGWVFSIFFPIMFFTIGILHRNEIQGAFCILIGGSLWTFLYFRWFSKITAEKLLWCYEMSQVRSGTTLAILAIFLGIALSSAGNFANPENLPTTILLNWLGQHHLNLILFLIALISLVIAFLFWRRAIRYSH